MSVGYDVLHAWLFRAGAKAKTEDMPEDDEKDNKDGKDGKDGEATAAKPKPKPAAGGSGGGSGSALAMAFRIPTAVACGLFLLQQRMAMNHGHAPPFSWSANPHAMTKDPLARVLSRLYIWSFNLWLLLFPKTLVCEWGMGSIAIVHSPADPRNACTAVMLLFLLWLFVTVLNVGGASARLSPQRRFTLGIGGALLAVPFLPASNAFVTVGFVVADRTLYMPSMGFIIILVWIVDVYLGGVDAGSSVGSASTVVSSKKSGGSGGRLGKTLLLAYCAAYAARTLARNEDWHTKAGLFAKDVAANPTNSKLWLFHSTQFAAGGKDPAMMKRREAAAREAVRLEETEPFATLSGWADP